MPFKAEALWRQLGEPGEGTPLSEALEPLKAGKTMEKPAPLFNQVPEETISELTEKIAERIASAKG